MTREREGRVDVHIRVPYPEWLGASAQEMAQHLFEVTVSGQAMKENNWLRRVNGRASKREGEAVEEARRA